MRRIYEHTEQIARQFPAIDFIKAPYLNNHPRVLDTFTERVHELLGEEQNLMNCKLCKYREQILGFEAEQGLPQESHHHHAEGTSASHHHSHGTHNHSHHHPYPHAAHPLGPKTLKK